MNVSAGQNRLAGEHAAYLVQHATDPTGWYPWGAEAFERARSSDRPVFLSIGYASCHWCHLMQRESFRDDETAAYLNEHFVPVAVDREERPDVDHLYQQYATFAFETGGWPLNVVLTPSLAPVYAGTYLPKRGSYAMQSLPAVLAGSERIWREERPQAEEAARNALDVLADLQAPKPAEPLAADDLEAIGQRVVGMEDREHGGLGGAPKTPQWPLLEFLLAHREATGHAPALETVERWVRAILRGGMYDHVGGGVFRYASDAAWTLPHFEKMLADNGMLLSVLASLHRLSPAEEYAPAIRSTAAFLGRELARDDGGFWSSLDAEAGGIEGAPYLWRYDELAAVLSAQDLALAERELGVTREGNRRGANVLARRCGREREAEAVDGVLAKLLAARASRPQPRAIRNAPTEWNAIAARGLIEAGSAIGESAIERQGLAALDALLEAEAAEGTRVPHLLGVQRAQPPLLADYAHLALACVAAADAGAEGGRDGGRYRTIAQRLLGQALETFEDGAVLHMTADGGLPVRPVAYDDVPVPSGMSALLDVHRRLHPQDAREFAQLFAPLNAFVRHAPLLAGHALAVASRTTG